MIKVIRMNTIFSKETSDGKPLMPKVVTCQDLEFEFFMKFEVDNIQRYAQIYFYCWHKGKSY